MSVLSWKVIKYNGSRISPRLMRRERVGPFGLVILDLGLPDGNGLRFLKDLKASGTPPKFPRPSLF